ncbi:ribonuclease-III-like-domain-containing protein [Phycomyces nitens]|nr:ribonuclease-III-like-domain-containing protein [Phycomyces nitens]
MLQRISQKALANAKCVSFTHGRMMLHTSSVLNVEQQSTLSSQDISKRLGIDFQTQNIVQQALTHKSFKHGRVPTNERLLVLGRRTIEFMAVEAAVEKGEKSAEAIKSFVRRYSSPEALSARFDALDLSAGLQTDLKVAAGSSIKAHAMKAVVGAIYHDKGSDVTREFLKKHLFV